ncbi:MAG: hypothetical protein FOGNACKC_04211 [Anaerolineae bacterium]|nr:hypothetical protein [Anaerolineae bacterium]
MINDSSITISFVGTLELKQLLETWAEQEDRSLSATLRQILTREAERRKLQPGRQEVIFQTK